jgi:osmotically-inducible protein OsmY
VEAKDLEVAAWARDERLRKDKHAFTSEDAIAGAVSDALRHDPRVDSSDLSVAIERREAILTGFVPNLRARRAAAETAANVVGVWSVTNDLRVQPIPKPSDKTIRAKVRTRLFYDSALSDQKITVMAEDGEVSLYGTVVTVFDKDRADELAASVDGVVDVANYLLLSNPEVRPEKTDLEIKEDIESELFWSPFVDAEEVEVAVHDGVATLTGVVDSRPESEAAEQNALEGGAIAVDNNLKIGGGHRR